LAEETLANLDQQPSMNAETNQLGFMDESDPVDLEKIDTD